MTISLDDAIAWHDLGRDPSSSAYEWFYFDVTEPDSTQLSVSLLAPNPFDLSPYLDLPGQPRCAACAPPNQPAPARHVGVTIHLSQPPPTPGATAPDPIAVQQLLHLTDGDPRMQFSATPWRLQIAETTVTRTIGQATGLPTCELVFDVIGAAGARAEGWLRFEATQPHWMVDDALLFEQQTDISHWHRWAVLVPRAIVNGEYRISAPGGGPAMTRKVHGGDGYHDHNWGSRRPADAFQRWMWARGSAGSRAVVAATIVPNVSAGFSDLRVASLFAVSDTAGVSAGVFTLIPGSSGDQSFAQRIDVGASAYRAVFDHLRVTLDIKGFYQRRVARLDLYDSMGGSPERGLAVAETMLPQSVG